MTVTGPPCAHCGEHYDFAARMVRYENCCRRCLPPQGPAPRSSVVARMLARITRTAWDVPLTAPPGRRIVFGTRSEDTGRWVRR